MRPAVPRATPSRTAPQKEVPLSELHSDEEEPSHHHDKHRHGSRREAPAPVAAAEKTAPPAAAAPAGRNGTLLSAPRPAGPGSQSPTAQHVEEEIVPEPEQRVSPIKNDSKDEIDEEVEYDEDFEEVSGEEEEYKPKVVKPQTPLIEQERSNSNKFVSIRPDSAPRRTPSPGPPGGPGAEPPKEDILKAMEHERMKALKKSNNAAPPPSNDSVTVAKRGFLMEYESSMPKVNFASASKADSAAFQRLRDLKEKNIYSRFATEKINLYSQRPQTVHSLFLSGKSLKYGNLRSVTCQTGEEPKEVGTMTEEAWTEDKDTQFPALTMGSGSKQSDELTQLLPFLRRTLPLFEAAMAEAHHRQLPSGQQAFALPGSEAPTKAKAVSNFGLPEGFVRRCLDAPVTIADISICPEWYGADHALVLYTWPWKQRPPPQGKSGTSLDAFTRPLQSMSALYPIMAPTAASGGGGGSVRPARCLYSFCRLTSVAVISGRSHIIVAGSEMGSLMAWDLRERPSAPSLHFAEEEDGLDPAAAADDDVAHFQGPIWLDAAFSTDSFAFSPMQDDGLDDLREDESEQRRTFDQATNPVVHTVEICCIRCSDGASGDPLIFALDVTGTTSFWRVLEVASTRGTKVRLALQGSVSLPSMSKSLGTSLCRFIDARSVCIRPQQQMDFAVVATSGVHQANRHQRVASAANGLCTLQLTAGMAADEEEDAEAAEDGGAALLLGSAKPCHAAYSPFFPGLLLVAYADGDLALFDSALRLPVRHWRSAISNAPNLFVSVAWSPCRPCVFFVKSAGALDIWDLAARSFAPVETVDLASLGADTTALPGVALASELHVSASRGCPIVGCGARAAMLALPAGLTTPLQSSNDYDVVCGSNAARR